MAGNTQRTAVQAIRLAVDARHALASRPGACHRIREQLGSNPETVRGLVAGSDAQRRVAWGDRLPPFRHHRGRGTRRGQLRQADRCGVGVATSAGWATAFARSRPQPTCTSYERVLGGEVVDNRTGPGRPVARPPRQG